MSHTGTRRSERDPESDLGQRWNTQGMTLGHSRSEVPEVLTSARRESLSWRLTCEKVKLVTIPLAAMFLLVSLSPFHTPATVAHPPTRAPQAGSVMRDQPFDSVTKSLVSDGLNLSIRVSPEQICVLNDANCTIGSEQAVVTLSATSVGNGSASWPSVQVLFVLETTPFDGVWDPYTPNGGGGDPCWAAGVGSGTPTSPCGESNGVPAFLANAGTIAAAIQGAHPFSKVTFGLVDYFQTDDLWDDGDQSMHPWWPSWVNPTQGWDRGHASEYRVDVGTFVPDYKFQSAVDSTLLDGVINSTFVLPGSNMSDNFLDSSSATALYGSMMGSGLSWSNDSHHVIVWIGSTAPRDPNYVVNYCVSGTTWMGFTTDPSVCISNDTNVTSPKCEPSHNFSQFLVSPACLGWVQSQDLNPQDSIAALSRNSGPCQNSLGRECTIDTVDLWAMPTDPTSRSWFSLMAPYPHGSTSGSWWAYHNGGRIINAGCDMANATGGTWDGPTGWNCGPGRTGTLSWVPHGNYTSPTTNNPTLLTSLSDIGFGNPPNRIALNGTSRPLLTFVPWGQVRIDTSVAVTVVCSSAVSVPFGCTAPPARHVVNGVEYLTWNWSTDPSQNYMYVGDSWTAQFAIEVIGSPTSTWVPVDACTGLLCIDAGSGPIGGLVSQAAFDPEDTLVPTTTSFPLAQIYVAGDASTPVSTNPPVPPPPGRPPPVVNPSPISLPTPLPSPAVTAVSVSGLSVSALAAGLLAAGFARAALRSRQLPQRMAAKAGPLARKPVPRSQFDPDAQAESSTIIRME